LFVQKENDMVASTPPVTTPKRRRRRRTNTFALREIRRHQKSTENLIPKAAFKRVVREILAGISPDMRVTRQAFAALQEEAEAHIVRSMGATNLIALHGKRQTITAKDMRLSNQLRGVPTTSTSTTLVLPQEPIVVTTTPVNDPTIVENTVLAPVVSIP
jgi:histone H3/H4